MRILNFNRINEANKGKGEVKMLGYLIEEHKMNKQELLERINELEEVLHEAQVDLDYQIDEVDKLTNELEKMLDKHNPITELAKSLNLI